MHRMTRPLAQTIQQRGLDALMTARTVLRTHGETRSEREGSNVESLHKVALAKTNLVDLSLM